MKVLFVSPTCITLGARDNARELSLEVCKIKATQETQPNVFSSTETNDQWALPGGRIVKKESLHAKANRQLKEIGIRPTAGYSLTPLVHTDQERHNLLSVGAMRINRRSPSAFRRTISCSYSR